MKKYLLAGLVLFMTSLQLLAQTNERTGWWKFNDPANVFAADAGYPLDIEGSEEFITGPDAGNNAVRINKGDYLILEHGINPNGGSDSLVNEYSIQIDFSIPVGGLWHSLFQTSDNTADAELFINTDNFIGAWRFGYSTNIIEEGTWYRMLVTVRNGEFYKLYIDGELWVDGAGQEIDSRDALAETMLIFADNDGEDETIDCSELSIWDVALTAEEVTELGNVSTVRVGLPPVFTVKKDTGIHQLSSNSRKGMARFDYWIAESGQVTFTLYDAGGRLIKEINSGERASGKNQLHLNTEQLRNGIYLLQMRSNQQLVSKQIVVSD